MIHDSLPTLIKIGASPDYTNSDHSICQLFQGGLGMPDRDYYFDEAKEEKRTAYKAHIAKMLYLLHQATDNNQTGTEMDEIPHEIIQDANAVYDLEKSLAEAHMTKTENRDPHATYNKMELLHLMSTVCQDKFDFKTFFSTTTGFQEPENELGEINVRNVAAIVRAVQVIDNADPSVLRSYLRWRCVSSSAKYLSKAFVMEDYTFNEKNLMGKPIVYDHTSKGSLVSYLCNFSLLTICRHSGDQATLETSHGFY
jgi:putative endopeptidase